MERYGRVYKVKILTDKEELFLRTDKGEWYNVVISKRPVTKQGLAYLEDQFQKRFGNILVEKLNKIKKGRQ